jgi:hypothetical protein
MQPVHLSIIRPIISPLSRPDIWHDGFLSQFVKISGADGLSLLLDCLRRTYYHIDIRYPENLIEEAAKVCTKYIIVYLEDIVKTRDFWNDFDDGAFPWESEGSQIKTVHLNHLICRDAENSPDAPSEFASLPRDHPPFTNENSNMYLLRWLVAGVFCRAAPASYKGILMELLFHRYWRVKQEALLGLERVLTSDDIDFVLTYLERRHSDIGWELLYLLDRKIYGCSLGASTLARIESIRRAHKLSEARMD